MAVHREVSEAFSRLYLPVITVGYSVKFGLAIVAISFKTSLLAIDWQQYVLQVTHIMSENISDCGVKQKKKKKSWFDNYEVHKL